MSIQGQLSRIEVNPTSADTSTTTKNTEATRSPPQMKTKPVDPEKTEKDGKLVYEGRKDLWDSDDEPEKSTSEKSQSSNLSYSSQSSNLLQTSIPVLKSRSSGQPEKSQSLTITQELGTQTVGSNQAHSLPHEQVSISKQETIASAFHSAIKAGNLDEVESLLQSGASVNQVLPDGTTPLLHAVKKGRTEIAALLLERGAAINQALNNNLTLLCVATLNGQMKMIKLLLEKGASINQPTVGGFTPLSIATRYGRVGVAALLLEKGASINQANNDGSTPLSIATEKGELEVAALLLEKGAAINQATNNGFTPLGIAAFYGQTKAAALLLEKGAAINQADNNGLTPLVLAARYGHTEAVTLLLENGAAVNLAAEDGSTPLTIAVAFGHTDVVSALLLKNKNNRSAQGLLTRGLQSFAIPYIDMPSPEGKTPLHIAVENRYFGTAAVLIAAKADLNLPDRDGNTPLLLAVASNDLATVNLLVQAGAKVGYRNKAGQIALDLALAKPQSHSLIIDLLLDTAPTGQQATRSANQQINMALLTEQAVALLTPGQQDDTQQAAAWKAFVNKLCASLGLRHIVAEGLAAVLRQMPPLWPDQKGQSVKPSAAQVRQFIRHMLASAQRLHELSNENDRNRAAFYDAPQALPAAAKLIGVAAGQSRQVIADAEAALRSWRGELETFLTSLTPNTITVDIQSKLEQQIGLHPLLVNAIGMLWISLEKPKSAAGLMQAMQKQFNTPAFASSVIEAGNSDVLRFMLMEQIKALTKR